MLKGKQYFIDLLTKEIKRFLDSNEIRLNVDGESFSNIRETLEDLGFHHQEDFETNGWDVEYSVEFTRDDITLEVEGSWFYGVSIIEKQ